MPGSFSPQKAHSGRQGANLPAASRATLERLGRGTLFFVAEMGRMGIFLGQVAGCFFVPPWRGSLIVRQMYFIGVGSVSIIFLTGLVLALQGFYTLNQFDSVGLLGPAVALGLLRELGPVLTALMVTGRAGSAMTAEIGIMVITEQIDALRSMAVNPLQRLAVPRIVAGILTVPLLTALFNVTGIFGGYLVSVKLLGLSSGTYFGEMQEKVEMTDIYEGIWKSLVFGLLVTWVCCYKGHTCGYGAEGVGKATTRAVVLSSVLILVADYVLTSILL
jgi:phospholipid/cholesterol/gamma-HCH transport system permease protein